MLRCLSPKNIVWIPQFSLEILETARCEAVEHACDLYRGCLEDNQAGRRACTGGKSAKYLYQDRCTFISPLQHIVQALEQLDNSQDGDGGVFEYLSQCSEQVWPDNVELQENLLRIA
eukprot:gb/GECG01003355.1/.p1 GENE.gb/GECG01003355.1/~~gb/GECG01003355.1/.p1  ORF type:complete len:117 (+),score=9.86 gb/GECG01003355.1/:1-351(+)